MTLSTNIGCHNAQSRYIECRIFLMLYCVSLCRGSHFLSVILNVIMLNCRYAEFTFFKTRYLIPDVNCHG